MWTRAILESTHNLNEEAKCRLQVVLDREYQGNVVSICGESMIRTITIPFYFSSLTV